MRGVLLPGCCPSESDPSERFPHPSPRSLETPAWRNRPVTPIRSTLNFRSQRKEIQTPQHGAELLTSVPCWVEPLWPSLMQRFLGSPADCRETNTPPDPLPTPAAEHTGGYTPRGAGKHTHRDASARTTPDREITGVLRQEAPSHLPQDDLFGFSVAYEQQQAADQQLLLKGEALGVRAAAVRRHAVAVNLWEHAGHLRKADLWSCIPQKTKVQRFCTCAFAHKRQLATAELTFSVTSLVWPLLLPLIGFHDLNGSPGNKDGDTSTRLI